jgi:PKD repeat protein
MFPRPALYSLVTALVLGFAATCTQSFAQALNPQGKAFPKLDLAQGGKGAEIPARLGANLHAVADWYGHTDADFRALCQREKSLGTDRKGRLHYACPGIAAAPGAGPAAAAAAQGAYPDSQTFLLHSRPGATKVIYLDFDGNTTSGTNWNNSFAGGADIVTPAYDTDGDPASFSSTELANVQEIWQRVAEDYAPFDVDVTTQDPGVEALRKTSDTDDSYGIRVCIGGSSYDWYGVYAGGTAYLRSFDWNTDTPVFVFPAQLGGGFPKYVAEAASHESGHSFGLHHDGQTNGPEYYLGQGNWAPIMGTSYYRDVTQWSRGEYVFANNQEDDLAIISSYVPYRADEAGNDTAHAVALAGSTFSVSGLIETTGDVDVFSFATDAGTVSITAAPASPCANLNLLLSLYDANGAPVTTVGPTALSAGATLATNLPAGNYYLAVNGPGSGDPVLDGYSNYGSIGRFSITGRVVPAGNQPPVAVASNSGPLTGSAPLVVNFSSVGSSDPDDSIGSYSWNFGDGTSSTAANPSHTYAAAGTYPATLTVYDTYGAASTPAPVTVVVSPGNQKPVAVAGNSAPLSGNAPLTVNFSSAGSSDPDGTIASYSWNFGDGTGSTAANPSHTYTSAGTYTATLTVIDDLGLASLPVTVSITAAVPNQRPVAMAKNSAPLSGNAPLTVNFSSVGSSDPDGTIASYSWNFGDGTTSTTANPSHLYRTGGSYTATLTVTDNRGLASLPVSVIITAKTVPVVYVASLTITKAKNSKGQTIATAVVTVKDQNGAVKSGATVAGKWTGLTTGNFSGKTNTSGVVSSASAGTTKAGTFTFSVTGITLSGFTYAPVLNTLTTISIVSP